MWEIGGQDRFGTIARLFYKDAQGAIFVYDPSRSATFDSAAAVVYFVFLLNTNALKFN